MKTNNKIYIDELLKNEANQNNLNKFDKEKKSIIYLRITVDGKICDISSKRKCESKKWNKIAGRMNSKEEGSVQFNSYLDKSNQQNLHHKTPYKSINLNL